MTAEDQARRLLHDEEAVAAFQIGLLDVDHAVADALDRLLADRERRRRAAVRGHAADHTWRAASPARSARLERGWTQRDLARVAGVSARAVWTAENTPELLRERTRRHLARALNTTPDALR